MNSIYELDYCLLCLTMAQEPIPSDLKDNEEAPWPMGYGLPGTWNDTLSDNDSSNCTPAKSPTSNVRPLTKCKRQREDLSNESSDDDNKDRSWSPIKSPDKQQESKRFKCTRDLLNSSQVKIISFPDMSVKCK